MADTNELTDSMVTRLLDAVHDVVRARGSWGEKRDIILARANDDERTDVEEFVDWFDGSDSTGDDDA